MTILERLTQQMEAVVPLVRDLQEILGEEVVNAALDERNRRNAEKARAAATPLDDLSGFAQGMEAYAAGDALEYSVIASDADRYDVDVTRCGYAAMMERLGARDIGHLLICHQDFALADAVGLELVRTQTCMQGASHCDFRYRKRER